MQRKIIARMDPKVKDYLAEKRQQEQQDRNILLIRLGLYEEKREYSNKASNDYPEWDSEQKKYVRITRIPCKVSDEEYEEILKYSKSDSSAQEETNRIENFLIHMGAIIIFIGIIGGVILGLNSPVEGIIIALSACISGAILMVLGRISIKLSNIEDGVYASGCMKK